MIKIRAKIKGGGSRAFAFILIFTALLFPLSALPVPPSALPSLSPVVGQAQENTACLECHGDASLSTQRDGATVSLAVAASNFSASVHGSLACVQCHADLENKELPHDTPPAKVACAGCHERAQRRNAESLHGQALARGDPLAPRCQDCHGAHEIAPARDPRSVVAPLKIPFVCGRCHHEGAPVQRQRTIHQDHILENYSESIHAEGLFKKGLVVSATCVSCHTAHHVLPHTDARSSIAPNNITATCLACHAEIEAVHRKSIRGELWEKEAHVLPACVDCHQPHKARKVFYEKSAADADCLRCHARPDIRRERDGLSLQVRHDDLLQSRHAAIACGQCHASVNPSLERPCAAPMKAVDCAACHAAVADQFLGSRHGALAAARDANAPTCIECHGAHAVRGKAEPASPTFPTKVPDLCARCHREGEKAAVRYLGAQHRIVERYTESIHGKGLLKSGLTVTATCTGCHTAHNIRPKSDGASSVNAANLPQTCGRCHQGIEEQFNRSIHSPLVAKTDRPLPVCNDCHTAHTIRRTDQDGFKLEIMSQCGRCHEDIAKNYFDTYHGKVSQLGYSKTAKCYDCHGAHDVLPVADPRSHLSRERVVETCRACHPGATRRFAGYLTHATHHDSRKYPFLFWTFWSMTALLVGVFSFFGIHTLLWLPRALQLRRERLLQQQNDRPLTGPPQRYYRRFSRFNRILHVLMIVSFISLALTGLTLKFSYTRWAVIMAHGFGGFETAGYIHRAAAVIMMGIFVGHLTDLVRRKRRDFGSWRALLFGPNTLLPTGKDFRDFGAAIKWFLGLGPRPQYGRWTYWEKFDYFAVFWGMAVIGSTGLALWFPELMTRLMPGWLLNIATIIHSDEALLAVGFIFTVHFFNTHLRPEKFPMDVVIFTGYMPVEDLREDKPGEYEALVQAGELDRNLVEPYPPVVIRCIRFFGWTALAIGFSVVVWIVCAMVFAYR